MIKPGENYYDGHIDSWKRRPSIKTIDGAKYEVVEVIRGLGTVKYNLRSIDHSDMTVYIDEWVDGKRKPLRTDGVWWGI